MVNSRQIQATDIPSTIATDAELTAAIATRQALSDRLTEIAELTPDAGQIIKWSGSAWAAAAENQGATLAFTLPLSESAGVVTIAPASGTDPGSMSAANFSKLAGIASGATANVTDAELRDRSTHTGTQAIATVSGLQAALDGKEATGTAAAAIAALEATKGQVNGLASLGADSKIPSAQLPAIAITDTFVVASQSAQTALTAQVGDVAVRTDLNRSYVLRVEPASTFGNWQELLTPTDTVLSVNGQTGSVTLTPASIGAQTVDTDLTAIADLTTAGFIVRTGAGTAEARSLTDSDIPNLPASKITSGTIDDARIPSSIARDSEVSGAIAAITPASIGAASAAFTTIAVSGQSDVVADSTGDTLTLVAGSNITLTTNATTDTVTIAASGGGSLPSGTSGQTLRHNGTTFAATSFLTSSNDTDATFLGSVQAAGNVTALPAGSSESTPRVFGFSGLSTGQAVRFELGDQYSGFRLGFNKRLQITSFHGTEIWGSRGTIDPFPWTNFTSTDANLSIVNTRDVVPLDILGTSGQSANFLQAQKSGGSVTFSVSSEGAVNCSGLTVAGTTVTALGRSLLGAVRQTFSNAAVTISAGTTQLAQIGSMLAARAITVPLANSVAAGTKIEIIDESNSVTLTNKLTLARSGSDTFSTATVTGATTADAIVRPGGYCLLISNGDSAWEIVRFQNQDVLLGAVAGTQPGQIWRDGDLLRFANSTGTAETILYSSGNLANLANTGTARRNLLGYDLQRTGTRPTVRSDGGALQQGDRWIDTTDARQWFWSTAAAAWLTEVITPIASSSFGASSIWAIDPAGDDIWIERIVFSGIAGATNTPSANYGVGLTYRIGGGTTISASIADVTTSAATANLAFSAVVSPAVLLDVSATNAIGFRATGGGINGGSAPSGGFYLVLIRYAKT